MKSIWKWILAIVVVMLVLGAVGAAAFMWRSHAFAYADMRTWDAPMQRGNDGWNDDWHNSPMMGRGSYTPFFGPFLFLGGLAKLAFFGALLYGAYWLGKRNARVVMDAAPSAPEPAPRADPPA
ncbi:MAG: hypothetical protein HY869_22215 [Chloroflexi bacterium]|nr:hypothetical protein [Chloroflexota bacterium]